MSSLRPTAGPYDAETTRRFVVGFALGPMPLTALAGQYLIVYALGPANRATRLSLPFLQFVLLSLGSTAAGLAVVRLATRRGALAVAYLLIQLTEACIVIALLAGVGALRLHPSAMPTSAPSTVSPAPIQGPAPVAFGDAWNRVQGA